MLSGERMPAQQQSAAAAPDAAAADAQQAEQAGAGAGAGSCGLGALLTAGCRGRAEAFARRLHRRLQTLGVGGGSAGPPPEAACPRWPPPPSVPVPVPATAGLVRVPSDGDVFYDPLDSPVETAQPAPTAAASALMLSCSSDSDSSEAVFFDPESSTTSSGSGADDEPFVAYNGCDNSTSSSTSSSDTGTLSGLSSSSSSALQVRVLGNASDDSRSTRTPSEDTRSPSGSDDSRPLSQLEPTPTPTASSCSTLDDSVCTGELDGPSAVEDSLSEALSRLSISGDSGPPLHNGLDDAVCRGERWSRYNGEEDHGEEPGAAQEDSPADCEAALVVAVELQLDCEPDAGAGCDAQSAENLRALCATAGDQQPACRIVVSPEPDCDAAEADADAAHDEDDEDSRPQRVRRCSSLKTGKTPPGTPGRKKIVRFADVLGLDLADVRTFLDEVPRVPSSAYDDLRDAGADRDRDPGLGASPLAALAGTQQSMGFAPTTTLVPLFPQPWTQPDFLDRVRDRQVCLESATLQDPALLSVCGVVRVRNLDFHKSVFVRYSTDGWRSWADAPARYVEGSCDGFSDRFQFVVYAHALPAGGRLELAVRFQCRGAQYWDSNGGANYAFQCVATAAAPALEPLSPVDDRWPSFY